MVAHGIPVLTGDYDYWIAIDDIEVFNRAALSLDLLPTHPPAVARTRGRYILEGGEHVDVLVARSVAAASGDVVTFDDAWSHRVEVEYAAGVPLNLTSIADLIRLKRVASRAKDLQDIRLLEEAEKANPR
jgi:hypothetical protein